MLRRWMIPMLQVGAVLLAALGLKSFYSAAGANDLLWILGPTTAGVELLTGQSFVFESHAGFINESKTFLIAPVCAGVNFLICAFVMTAFQFIRQGGIQGAKWGSLAAAGVVSYLFTIAANAVRISLSLSSFGGTLGQEMFDRDQIHRIEGIAVYFGFLVITYFLVGRWIAISSRKEIGSSPSRASALLPLAVYLSATLLVPLANGAYRNGPEFWEHSLYVLVIPLLISLPVLLLVLFLRQSRVGRNCGRRSGGIGTETEDVSAVRGALPGDPGLDDVRT